MDAGRTHVDDSWLVIVSESVVWVAEVNSGTHVGVVHRKISVARESHESSKCVGAGHLVFV